MYETEVLIQQFFTLYQKTWTQRHGMRRWKHVIMRPWVSVTSLTSYTLTVEQQNIVRKEDYTKDNTPDISSKI